MAPLFYFIFFLEDRELTIHQVTTTTEKNSLFPLSLAPYGIFYSFSSCFTPCPEKLNSLCIELAFCQYQLTDFTLLRNRGLIIEKCRFQCDGPASCVCLRLFIPSPRCFGFFSSCSLKSLSSLSNGLEKQGEWD